MCIGVQEGGSLAGEDSSPASSTMSCCSAPSGPLDLRSGGLGIFLLFRLFLRRAHTRLMDSGKRSFRWIPPGGSGASSRSSTPVRKYAKFTGPVATSDPVADNVATPAATQAQSTHGRHQHTRGQVPPGRRERPFQPAQPAPCRRNPRAPTTREKGMSRDRGCQPVEAANQAQGEAERWISPGR